METSSACDLSRDPDLLQELGRGAAVRPLVAILRLSKDNDLSRVRADSVLKRVKFFSADRLCGLHSAPEINTNILGHLYQGLKQHSTVY